MTNSTEPLGLPRGTVRAVLTVLLLLIVAAMLFVPVVEGATELRGMIVLLAGIAVKSYFDTRQEQNEADGPALPDPDPFD